MDNYHEEGTLAWQLMEEAEKISSAPASGNETADALDRLTAALYRIGAAYTANDGNNQGLYSIAEEIREASYRLQDDD
ncbi:MAG: hypothetical protein WD005_06425 [Haliea sp.]